MKKILILVVVLLLVGVVVYRYVPVGESQKTAVAVGSLGCIDSLYSTDRAKYDFWKNTYATLHPELSLYDTGAYCPLTDGTQLVSFSYFVKADQSKGQSLALFDANNKLLKETRGLYESTLGDLGYPYVSGVNGDEVGFNFSGSDATLSESTYYILNLTDMSYKKIEAMEE